MISLLQIRYRPQKTFTFWAMSLVGFDDYLNCDPSGADLWKGLCGSAP